MNVFELCSVKNGEKPLDNIAPNGGFCRIFNKMAVIGDSLSSGTLEATDENGERLCLEFEDYSWVKYFSSICGCNMLNFSRGGMTAKEFCESYAEEKDFFNPEKACQAYIILLGWNDFYGRKTEAGNLKATLLKTANNDEKTTFCDWYVEIINRFKAISPEAKFFFVTLPHSDNTEWEEYGKKHSELLYSFAEHFSNSYVVDIRKYGPRHNAEFKKSFFMGGHLTPCGYVLAAQTVASYIDYIIRSDFSSFKQIAFTGTPYKYKGE